MRAGRLMPFLPCLLFKLYQYDPPLSQSGMSQVVLDRADRLSVAQVLEPLCKSSETWQKYAAAVENYIKHRGLEKWTELLGEEAKQAEDAIIEYFHKLEQDGLTANSKNVIRAGLQKFFTSQRARLDWDFIKSQIVSKNPDSVNLDRAYTRAEIARLLDVANTKYRAIIHVFASSGIRAEALCQLRYKDYRPVKRYDLLYLKPYAGSSDEYDAFGSRNALSAVVAWLRNWKEKGNPLTDDNYIFPGAEAGQPMDKKALDKAMVELMKKAGIARVKISKRRYDLTPCHGFRKFFSSTLEATQIPFGVKEALMGHRSGVAGRYRRPPVTVLLANYVKYAGGLEL
jgi:integrase